MKNDENRNNIQWVAVIKTISQLICFLFFRKFVQKFDFKKNLHRLATFNRTELFTANHKFEAHPYIYFFFIQYCCSNLFNGLLLLRDTLATRFFSNSWFKILDKLEGSRRI